MFTEQRGAVRARARGDLLLHHVHFSDDGHDDHCDHHGLLSNSRHTSWPSLFKLESGLQLLGSKAGTELTSRYLGRQPAKAYAVMAYLVMQLWPI